MKGSERGADCPSVQVGRPRGGSALVSLSSCLPLAESLSTYSETAEVETNRTQASLESRGRNRAGVVAPENLPPSTRHLGLVTFFGLTRCQHLPVPSSPDVIGFTPETSRTNRAYRRPNSQHKARRARRGFRRASEASEEIGARCPRAPTSPSRRKRPLAGRPGSRAARGSPDRDDRNRQAGR